MAGRMILRHERWGRGAAGLVLLLGSGSLAVWPGTGASAQTAEAPSGARSVVATASSQGMRMTYTVPDLFVVEEFIDGGGPVAQATVDSTGQAVSFASLPYPGVNAVTFPGLLSFLTGAPIPNYPFYARADHPVQPRTEVKDPSGTYALLATAEAGKAAGSADFLFGGAEAPVSGSSADASGVLDATGVTVEAVSVNQGLVLGDGVLSIASVTSRSVTTYATGAATPETKTELVIQGAKVGDQAVTIGPDGVHPGDQSVPIPFNDGADSLNQALAQAGINVKTIRFSEIDGGAAGDVLEITMKHPVPGAENVQGTLVIQMGGASSSVAFGEAVPVPGPIEGAPLPQQGAPPPVSAAAPAPATTEVALPAPDVPPAFPAVAAGGPLPLTAARSRPVAPLPGLPVLAVPDLPVEAPLVAAPPVTALAEPVVLARDFSGPTKALFSILGVAGALLVSSSALWRFLGAAA